MYHVDYTVNGTWCWTLSTVESEIPSPAACMTVVETKIATPEDTQPSSVWCFLKNALLKNQQRKKDQRGELKLNIRDKQLHDRVQKLIWKLWVSLAVTEEFLRGNMLTMDQFKTSKLIFPPWMGKGNCFSSDLWLLTGLYLCYCAFGIILASTIDVIEKDPGNKYSSRPLRIRGVADPYIWF